MKRILMSFAAASAFALGGCGEEAPAPLKTEVAANLAPGEYEVSSEVTKLASADQSIPATALKVGDKNVTRACVAPDGSPDQAMFVDAGDSCMSDSTYVRSGRLSIQYQCSRPGKGKVFPAADGNFTADGFEAVVTVSTTFAGDGDYSLTRRLTAKRVGACPAAGAATPG